VETNLDMRRCVLFFGALWALGCGSDGATVLGPGGAGAPSASAGAAGSGSGGSGGGPGSSGTGGSTSPEAGSGGSAGAVGSDVISVDDGDFNTGEPPVTAGDGELPQIVGVTGPSAVTNGGTAILHIQLSPAIESPQFVVGLVGDTGYHTVVGADPDADGIYDISVQVNGEATQPSLVLTVALIDAAGNVGPYHQLEIELVRSGTGDVKVTLSFDRLHDLDLRVVEPNGEEISYTNDASQTGGKLDLDSGSHCEPNAANAENIFWPPEGAPPGEYIVNVQNFEQCSPGDIDFTVRVAYDNRVNTYRGTFADGTAGEAITANNVQEVVRFTRGVVPP
jgi:hypothetical protein